MMRTWQVDGTWVKPEVVSFSGTEFYDCYMVYSPDGKHLYFCSNKPTSFSKEAMNIWVSEKNGTSWSAPTLVAPPVNSSEKEIYPWFVKDGSMYFSSGRDGGYGENDIYYSRMIEGKFVKPENLGSAINSKHFGGDLVVDTDVEFMIVSITDREDSYGKTDLYISFR